MVWGRVVVTYPTSLARKDLAMQPRTVLFALFVALALAVLVDTLTALAFAALFAAVTRKAWTRG